MEKDSRERRVEESEVIGNHMAMSNSLPSDS